MIDLQQSRSQEQDHESGKKANVRPTRQTTATHTRLPQTFLEHATEAGLKFAEKLAEIAGDEFPDANWPRLPPQSESPPDAIGENNESKQRQPIEEHDRSLGDIAECFAGGGHGKTNSRRANSGGLTQASHAL